MAGEMEFTVKRTFTGMGLTTSGITQKVLCDGGIPLKKEIPANTTNGQFLWPITVSKTKFVSIETNKDCDIYVNAASTGSPAQHWVMAAGIPKSWVTGDEDVLFILQNVTSLFITTGDEDTKLVAIEGHDATPVLGE